MTFQHPTNGYKVSTSVPFLWALLFGGFYFLRHRMVMHFFISWGVAIFTCGISWFLYPVFARSMVRNHYMRQGWLEA